MINDSVPSLTKIQTEVSACEKQALYSTSVMNLPSRRGATENLLSDNKRQMNQELSKYSNILHPISACMKI